MAICVAPRATKAEQLAALEEALLTKLNQLQQACNEQPMHLARKLEPALFEETGIAISALEQSTPGFGDSTTRLRKLLPGTWKLVVTDSKAVEANAGSITGLGSLPGAQCTEVNVVLQQDGRAKTVEKIKVFGGFMEGENSLLGKWTLSGWGGKTLQVTYANAVLMGRMKLRADSKAVLQTSYCSERIRIGRGKSGDFYVFIRVS